MCRTEQRGSWMVTRCIQSASVAEHIRSILTRYVDDGLAACVVEADQLGSTLTVSAPAPGLVFLVLSDSVDQSMAAVVRLQGVSGAPIIAVGTTRDQKEALRFIRAGASDFLVADEDLEQEIDAVIRRVTGGDQAPCGRIVTVTAASGAGRSVIACNLAAAVAQQAGRCVLCDLQLHGGDQAMLLNLSATHTIVDLCRNVDTLDQAMFEQSLVPHEGGIQLLAAPLIPKEPSLVDPSAVLQILKIARRTCSTTILDLNDPFRDDHAAILRQSDVIVLVLRLEFPSLIKTCRALKHFESIGITENAVRIVGNRYGQLGELCFRKIEECLTRKIDYFIPDDSKLVNASLNVGTPVVIGAPKSKFAKGIWQLADCLAPVKNR